MKKNKERRVFSRVLAYLSWATAHRLHGGQATAYREATAAKRELEEHGFEDVRVLFYDREYHLQFTVHWYRDALNRYYTISASHGCVNDYHRSNRYEILNLIGKLEFSHDCALSRDFHDYQMFNESVLSVLYMALTPGEFSDYCHNGEVSAIPYDDEIRLWRELHSCLENIVNEAVAHKKVML